MKVLRVITGLLALFLTFLGISLLVGPFLPSVRADDLTFWEHVACAVFGIVALASSVFIWIWSNKASPPK